MTLYIGNLSVLLSPYVKSIQGIDVTQGMVDTYNEKAVSLPDKNIHAKVANITEPTDLKPLQSTKYDLIFTQLALHHIPNAEEIVSLLATLLKETGKLVLVDFENTKDGQGFHESHGHVAHQHGFTRGEVEGWFGKANLKVEEFKSRAVTLTKQHVEEGNKALGGSAESKSFPIFVAVGSK
ncbi:S-adenosyl-L-methionine-dependent methyltransferase [Phlyctochytrium arcticum]|nr:S-adenosyl-L-methionine-dependent methyltransferase [Phlyctochytrium arcticum]